MVAGEDGDGAVGDAFEEGVHILRGPQRRVHFVVGVEAAHCFVGEGDVVRADFSGDGDAASARPPQDADAACRREVLAVDVSAGEFGELGVALDDDFFAERGPAGQAERGAHVAFVHDAFADEVDVLAMVHDGEVEHFGVFQGAPHEFVVLDATAVVGEGDDARFGHRADGGEFFAREAFGDGPGWEDVDASFGAGFVQYPPDHAGAVDGGGGIGHANDAGEAARCRCFRAAADGFLCGLPRLAEVDMDVDQAGRDDEPGAVDFLDGIAKGNSGVIGDAAVDDQEVGDFVTVIGRVDNAAIAEEGGHRSC